MGGFFFAQARVGRFLWPIIALPSQEAVSLITASEAAVVETE